VSATAEALAAPELEESWLAGCLSDLVATPSVTGVDSERAMVERIATYLEPTRCELTVVESLPGRPSLAAVLEGAGGGPRLVLNGHTDTVPPDDLSLWSVDPFGGAIADGAVWGRGALDMKGGLVCQIACAHVLSRLQPRGTLVLHFACGEETGEPGTLSLLERGFVGDVGITTEPTALAVAVAQRGTAYFRIVLHGRSAHASTPDAGVNPLRALPAVLAALERYNAEIGRREHPLLPPATCTPTMVRAGVQQNAIPDTCELVVDRRLLPGDTPEDALRELEAVVGSEATVEPLHHPFAPSEIPADSPFVSRVLDTVEAVTGRREPVVGTPYGSDVRNLINDAGIEAVTFGPGDVRGAHCPDERLDLAELRQAALVIATLAVDLLA
jgi:succinyl-diaminopimelate desuccinylase